MRDALLLRIHVARVNRAHITDRIYRCQCCRSLGRRARDRVRDPSQRHPVAGVYAGDHQHHRHIARCGGGGGRGEDEGRDADAERQHDVQVALARAVSVPGVQECRDDSQDVRRGGEEERLDVAVSKGFDDGGEEVRHGA